MRVLTEAQFAAMNLIYLRCSPDYFLDSVCRLGIPNIELWGVSPFFCELDKSTSDVKALRNAIESRGLKLVSFIPEQCTLPFNIASQDKAIQARSVEYFKKHIATAAELGAGRVLLTPGWACVDEPNEEGFKRSVEALKAVAPLGREYGVKLVLENLQYPESNLLYNLETMARYADAFDEGEMYFAVDTVPVQVAGEKLADYFALLGKRLQHVHLIDGVPDGHMALGDGEHVLTDHLDAMSANDYDGYATLEFGDEAYYRKPEFHMKRGWDYLKRYLPYSGGQNGEVQQ